MIAQTGRFPAPARASGCLPPSQTGRFAEMASQNPAYHYNKAREMLNKAEKAEYPNDVAKYVELAKSHMEIYATLKQQEQMHHRPQPAPYYPPGVRDPWQYTYGMQTHPLGNTTATGTTLEDGQGGPDQT